MDGAIKGTRKEGKGSRRPWFRVLVGLVTCTGLLVTAVLLTVSLWTVVSYQGTVSDLQHRLQLLESQQLHLDQIIEQKVNALLDQVRISVFLYPCFSQ